MTAKRLDNLTPRRRHAHVMRFRIAQEEGITADSTSARVGRGEWGGAVHQRVIRAPFSKKMMRHVARNCPQCPLDGLLRVRGTPFVLPAG